MNQKKQRHDHALSVMTLDIVRSVLGRADNLPQLVELIMKKTRELSGARTIILFKCLGGGGDKHEHRMLGVEPQRRDGLAKSPEIQRLIEIVHDLTGPALWRSETRSQEAECILDHLGYGLSLAVPLDVGAKRAGALLMLGLIHDRNIESVAAMIETLSGIIALVLQNCFLIEEQRKMIRKRKQAEEQIQALTRQLIKVQENERKRICHNLHESVAQDLSTLKIGFETLFDHQAAAWPEIRERVSDLSSILNGVIGFVRDISYDLSPAGLSNLGLIHTVYEYCQDFSENTGIQVDFSSAGTHGLLFDFDTQINLYRMIQEALENIKRHANADRVKMRLVASFPMIILRIEDNGRGFDLEKLSDQTADETRVGLISMKERIGLLNGNFRIQSRQNEGTKIVVEVPFR